MTVYLKPFSTEWHARERAWEQECDANYDTAAADLVALGLTRHDREHPAADIYPATFTQGDRTIVLVRNRAAAGQDNTELHGPARRI